MGSHIMPPLGAINPNHIPAALLTRRSGRARQLRPGVGADPRVRPVFHDLPPVEFDVDEPVWSSAEFPSPSNTHGAAMGYSDAAPYGAIADARSTRIVIDPGGVTHNSP